MDKEVVVLMYNGISLSHEINVIRDGISCEASNPYGNDRHVFHFGTGE